MVLSKMKKEYCELDGCPERCMKRSASITCVVIGALGVGLISSYKLGIVKNTQNLSDFATGEFYLALLFIIIFTLIAIFLSLFERFEHYITAIIFGVSVPGLLYAIANIGAVQ